MKNKKKPLPAGPGKKAGPATASRERSSSAANWISSLEASLAGNSRFYRLLIPAIALVLSLLCFDNKISIANDDALYIEAGANYAKDFFGYFYTGNAPLYPMLLGLAIKLVGMNLFLLKCLSIVFFSGALYLLYTTFEKRIPYAVLIPALLLTAINFPYLMYASLTYSECLYLLIMAVAFRIVLRATDRILAEEKFKPSLLLPVLAIGFSGLLFVITRNIALVGIVAVLLYLVIRRRFIEAACSGMAFGAFYFLYQFLVRTIWHLDRSQYAAQSKIIFQKDAYNPQMGQETIGGYVQRLIDNAQIYISSRFMYVLGFREEMSPVNAVLTLVCIGIVLWALYRILKKQQYPLLLTTLFFGVLLGTNFVALQTSWGQSRFIMVYLPLILFALFYLVYDYATETEAVGYIYATLIAVLFVANLTATFRQVKVRLPVFIENMTGDPTYGYTPDWQNFIRMSRWVKQNLPDSVVVASRKAPMSFIFSGGREFYGVYNTPAFDADSLLTPLRQNKVDYFILSELRIDPNRYIQGQFINTMHRYAYFIIQKYPNAFQFVHREGTSEIAEIYKIDYAYIDSVKTQQ